MKLKDIIKNCGVTGIKGSPETEILGMTNDSRNVLPGSLFVAVTGCGNDGRAHIADALKAGAAAVMCKGGCEAGEAVSVDVADSRLAVAMAADNFYGHPSGRLKLVGITGTNGKTTTTSLVEKILLRAGKKAVACGNYGVPMAEVLLRDAVPDVLALEVSSFQLETIRDFHPDVAVWLNFAPDHMDRYTAVEDYYKAKLHIFDNQTENDLAVVRFGEHLPALKALVRTFSSESPEADLYYREPLVMEGDSPLLNLAGTSLSQRHNAENVMAAVLACRHLGIPAETAAEVLEEFTPPSHRCEAVRSLDGVLWLNDSKATNLHALEAALKSQNAPVVLIAGGKDKGLDYLPLRPMLKEKVRACVVFGQIADQLYDSFSPAAPTEKAADVADCVEKARLLARPGDTVLFSPGTSSFDMFTGYAQRGQAFRDAVNALSPLS